MSQQSIAHFFENDHDRLDLLFTSYRQLKRFDVAKAGSCFRQFRSGLERHIIWEEEILFPLFERKTGLSTGGPTQAMRVEHLIIRTYLDEIYQQVQLQSPETDSLERKLLEVLMSHNDKEEQILYPAIERCIEGDEMTHVFRSMEGFAEERHSL